MPTRLGFFLGGGIETGFLGVALAALEFTPEDQASLELRGPPASVSQCWD